MVHAFMIFHRKKTLQKLNCDKKFRTLSNTSADLLAYSSDLYLEISFQKAISAHPKNFIFKTKILIFAKTEPEENFRKMYLLRLEIGINIEWTYSVLEISLVACKYCNNTRKHDFLLQLNKEILINWGYITRFQKKIRKNEVDLRRFEKAYFFI